MITVVTDVDPFAADLMVLSDSDDNSNVQIAVICEKSDDRPPEFRQNPSLM